MNAFGQTPFTQPAQVRNDRSVTLIVNPAAADHNRTWKNEIIQKGKLWMNGLKREITEVFFEILLLKIVSSFR